MKESEAENINKEIPPNHRKWDSKQLELLLDNALKCVNNEVDEEREPNRVISPNLTELVKPLIFELLERVWINLHYVLWLPLINSDEEPGKISINFLDDTRGKGEFQILFPPQESEGYSTWSNDTSGEYRPKICATKKELVEALIRWVNEYILQNLI